MGDFRDRARKSGPGGTAMVMNASFRCQGTEVLGIYISL